MKKILLGILLVIFSLSKSLGQETGEISGKILDAELYNEPLLMANVSLKNTNWSAQTNFNGNFEITSVPRGSYILEIQFLGYESKEMPIEVRADEKVEVYESLKAKSLPLPLMSEATHTDFIGSSPSHLGTSKLNK